MTDEEQEVLQIFNDMLQHATLDGGRKRRAGLKPSWKIDKTHKAAVFSHMMKRERGELADTDTGMHPYVHAAWRLLAIAYQETHGGIAFVEDGTGKVTHLNNPQPVTPGRASQHCSKLYCYQEGTYPNPNGNGYLCINHAINPPPSPSPADDEIPF